MLLGKKIKTYIFSIITFVIFVSISLFINVRMGEKYNVMQSFDNKMMELNNINNNEFMKIKKCLDKKYIDYNIEFEDNENILNSKIITIGNNQNTNNIFSCITQYNYDIYDKPKLVLSNVPYVHVIKSVDKSYYHLDYLTSSSLNIRENIFRQPIKSYCCKYGNNCPKQDQCIYTFVIDTGVEKLKEFDDNIDSTFEYPKNHTDNIGHGTFCASVINSKTHGINPNTIITSIKLLETDKTENIQHIINVFQYMIKLGKSNDGPCSPEKKCVINMSFVDQVDGKSILIKIMQELYKTNSYILVSSAGNYAKNACSYSPGNLNEVINIGSIKTSLFGPMISKFSNYGNCVDFWYFGENIAGLNNKNQIIKMSGTSMSSPIASAIISIYLNDNSNSNYYDILTHLESSSKKCLINNSDKDSNKRNFILSLDNTINNPKCKLVYTNNISLDRK